MSKPRFSKEDLLREVHGLILAHARSLSWVYDLSASHRLLGWPAPPLAAVSALREVGLLDFDEVARQDGQSAELSHLPITQVFGQLYDYGVMGLLRDALGPMAPCTEPAFVAAWMHDVVGSRLIHEVHAGIAFSDSLARATVELAQARAVLDEFAPEGRFYFGTSEPPPDGMLTFAEVALLGDMDERSVRNAASKRDSELVATSSEDGRKSYIKVPDARNWLQHRKGFVPTRRGGLLEDFDLLSRAFTGKAEAAEFLRVVCEQKSISLTAYLELCGEAKSPLRLDWASAPLPDGAAVPRVAKALGLHVEAFQLRLEELQLAENAEKLQKSLAALRAGRPVRR